jgi:hypothetical protein
MTNETSILPPPPPIISLPPPNPIISLPPPSPILPPQVIKYPPSTFNYLPEKNRLYVSDAYEVISRNEWWGSFRAALLERGVDSNTGFMFNTDPLYRRIMDAIGLTEIGSQHSGSSMAFVMREMKTIALQGEPAYRSRYTGETTP